MIEIHNGIFSFVFFDMQIATIIVQNKKTTIIDKLIITSNLVVLLSYNCNTFSVAAYPTVETTMVTKPIDISFTIIPFRIAGIEIPAVPKRM